MPYVAELINTICDCIYETAYLVAIDGWKIATGRGEGDRRATERGRTGADCVVLRWKPQAFSGARHWFRTAMTACGPDEPRFERVDLHPTAQ
jgi:hypothetical protein